MAERTVAATEFKATCLALIDEVARTRRPIVVSKRGRPVARLIPVDDRPPATLEGSIRILVDDDELLFSTGEAWEVQH